jgi:type II secretory pathway component PulM
VNLRAAWTAVRRWYDGHSTRDRRIVLSLVGVVALSIVYVVVVEPLRAYRRGVAEEIGEGQDQLERSMRFLGALDALRAERDEARAKLEHAKQRLLPGNSGTLGAAALQERANTLASEKGITVQSTQVMKEEVAEPFRKVAVRLTLSGELRPFADFIAGLEYGQQQLFLPFVEVNRRGAVAGAKGPRTLAATVEVSGYLVGVEKPEEKAAAPDNEGGDVDGEGGPQAEGAPQPEEGAPARPPAPGAVAPTPPTPEVGPPLPSVEAPQAGPPLAKPEAS